MRTEGHRGSLIKIKGRRLAIPSNKKAKTYERTDSRR